MRNLCDISARGAPIFQAEAPEAPSVSALSVIPNFAVCRMRDNKVEASVPTKFTFSDW